MYRSRAERIAARVDELDEGLGQEQRAVAVARIESEEAARPARRAVAGFDLTFSAPKSVSVLWALADPDTRAVVEQAHHAAIADVIALVDVARQVVAVAGERRSTWRRWNLHAEASRQLAGVRFATTADRETVLDQVVTAAGAASVRLTPPDLASVPAELQRADGTTVLRPRHSDVFTSDTHDTEPHQHDRDEPLDARQVLAGVLARTGAEPSAHQTVAGEQDRYDSIGQLVAEYETIAVAARRPRWAALIRTSGLTAAQADAVSPPTPSVPSAPPSARPKPTISMSSNCSPGSLTPGRSRTPTTSPPFCTTALRPSSTASQAVRPSASHASSPDASRTPPRT